MKQFSLHSNNIISLDIYFQDMSYDVIEQTPVFESWTLIGKLSWCAFNIQHFDHY